MRGRIYVILLNWNGWRDTLECLESVLKLDHPDFHVLVCDNASSDDSIVTIKLWAQGSLPAVPSLPEFQVLTTPSVPKPVSLNHYLQTAGTFQSLQLQEGARLTLIETGGNLGFAAGCNAGIRFALTDPECVGVWLLNNDTVVMPNSLTALVAYADSHPGTGLVGSTIRYYHAPARVQAYGGTSYSPWSARTPKGERKNPPFTRLACILGASMLATRPFLETVGLMSEDYFLYCEELDWAERARGTFALGHATESVVYHKEGASIGSSGQRAMRSILSDRYLSRNRILFTRKFYPFFLPSVAAWVAAAILVRVLQGQISRSAAMLRAAFEGLREPYGK